MEESKDRSLSAAPRLNTEENEQEERTSLRPPIDSQEDEQAEGEGPVSDDEGDVLDEDCVKMIVMKEKLRHDRI